MKYCAYSSFPDRTTYRPELENGYGVKAEDSTKLLITIYPTLRSVKIVISNVMPFKHKRLSITPARYDRQSPDPITNAA
jgi:hypothetical protein